MMPTPTDRDGLLTGAEVKALIAGLLDVRGEAGASEPEILDFVKWANGMKAYGLMFRMLVDGEIVADWDPEIGDARLALPGTPPRAGGR